MLQAEANGLQTEKLVEFVGNRRVEITKVGIVARYYKYNVWRLVIFVMTRTE